MENTVFIWKKQTIEIYDDTSYATGDKEELWDFLSYLYTASRDVETPTVFFF